MQASYMIDGGKKDESERQKEKPKKTATDIKFGGGRPTRFTNNRKLGGDDFVALTDIGDDGKEVKNQKKAGTRAEGGGDFENLGASAVSKTKKFEEGKEQEEKKPAERPRFFGRAKIGGGDAK